MKTPLYNEHVAMGARMALFAGWNMPVVYNGILEEHQHTRQMCSIFDICHMGKFEFRGPTAASDLDHLLTPAVAVMAVGRGVYGYLLDEQGRVLDDVIVFRLSADRFWLVVNAGTKADDAKWIQPRLSRNTIFEDLDQRIGKLDIQGPRARVCVEKALNARLPDIRYFHVAEINLMGRQCLLSRTGYTGEFGYELYPPLDACAAFWKALLAPGEIRPAGLGARDTLRMEMGYPLNGHELSSERTPVSATGSRFLAMDKPFIGRDAVERELRDNASERLVGLRLEGRMAARAGDRVFMEGRDIGIVTSGLFSPSLHSAIAMAYVESACAQTGVALQIRVRGKTLDASVVSLPFYLNGTCRQPSGPS